MKRTTTSILLYFGLSILTFVQACGSAENQPENTTIDTTSAAENKQAAEENMPYINDTAKASDASMKTAGATVMNMTFVGFNNNDYPEFKFRDQYAGNFWDFRFLSENKLGNSAILLVDKNAKFGFKANPEMINKTFVVETIQKEVEWKNLQGKMIRSKEYVINQIKLK